MGWVIVYSLCNMIYQEFFIQNFSQPTVTKYRNHHIYIYVYKYYADTVYKGCDSYLRVLIHFIFPTFV